MSAIDTMFGSEWRLVCWTVEPLEEVSICQRTLKVCHVRPYIRVQSIDDHLPVGRTGDLNPSVNETRRWWCALPCIVLADVLGLWEEIWNVALVELSLANHAALKECFSGAIESAVEQCKENSGLFGEDLAGLVIERTEDVDVLQDIVWVGGHDCNMFCLFSCFGIMLEDGDES